MGGHSGNWVVDNRKAINIVTAVVVGIYVRGCHGINRYRGVHVRDTLGYRISSNEQRGLSGSRAWRSEGRLRWVRVRHIGRRWRGVHRCHAQWNWCDATTTHATVWRAGAMVITGHNQAVGASTAAATVC
jgi:hypothetical protein